MPGKHDLRNHQIALKLPHETWRRVEKDAATHRMIPSAYLRWVITEAVRHVELTPEDIDLIAARIKEAMNGGKFV